MRKWKVKNPRIQRQRRSNTHNPQSKRSSHSLPTTPPISTESWIDQLRHSFQKETPKDWLPGPYQSLYQHSKDHKIGA